MWHLVSEQGDEAFGLSLQVQVHVVELPIEGLVHLLLPLCPAGLLHGLLHAWPVQIPGQVAQEHAHMLCVVQGDTQLAESTEERQSWREEKAEADKEGVKKLKGKTRQGYKQRRVGKRGGVHVCKCVTRENKQVVQLVQTY